MSERRSLPFSEPYQKLELVVFPTIRRRDKFGDVGDPVLVELGPQGDRETIGEAIIIGKEKITMGSAPENFLHLDTGHRTREEALASINEFYRHEITPTEELTTYWNKWTQNPPTLDVFR